MNDPNTHKDEQTLPIAEFIGIVVQDDMSSALELRVNIEGQDLPILLPLSALPNIGETNQAVAEELRKIQKSLEDISGALPHSGVIANEVFLLIDSAFQLPRRETG